MLRTLAKLLKVLNSETEPGFISLGFCFALVAGLTPLLSLHNFFVLLLVMVLRVNLSAFILGLLVFTGAAYLVDPLSHSLGFAVLSAGSLKGIWTTLYNSTFWRIENFNNTIVMGSLLISLTLFFPAFFLFNFLIRKYREHILQWVLKTRMAQAIKASKFFQVYQKVSGWGDAA